MRDYHKGELTQPMVRFLVQLHGGQFDFLVVCKILSSLSCSLISDRLRSRGHELQSGVGTSVATSSLPWLALRRTAFAGDPARKVFKQIASVEAKMLIPPSGSDFR